VAKYFAWEGRLAAAGNAALLGRALRQRVWEDSPQQCRQLPNGASACVGVLFIFQGGCNPATHALYPNQPINQLNTCGNQSAA
jgi:hypothetical protein